MATDVEQAVTQIEAVMGLPESFEWSRSDWGDYPDSRQLKQFTTASLTCIERLAGRESVYYEQSKEELQRANPDHHHAVDDLLGILSALKSDIEAGYLDSVREEVEREVTSDFLALAETLVEEGRSSQNEKPLVTAAAVLAGGVLEEHVRRLCNKAGIDITRTNRRGDSERKKVSLMNDELRSNGTYEQIDHDNVQSWYRIRTHAAHAEYDKYDVDRVELMILGLRKFVTDYPA